MKITYLSLIAVLSTGLAVLPQRVMAQQGQRRFRQQSNQHAQRQLGERERNGNVQREERQRRTNGNVKERERQREQPNGAIEQQRQIQRTDAAGQTQTRSQERTRQPNP
jgi:hypothetical protein